ncbi:Beta-lactamase hydrolase-like protein [Marinomonas aquimarina]|uniref:Beta-lactamase hydrolase-like protein n=1 Tax=Marinomonas aquimarina TaxID=295068 RepID=A0A1A8TNG8_9GAMM|nr:TIGR01244 family sulfur transferase [Marinomonas aquimarina]SBS35675.1 Beta-lactamase hydrolase-like protein [Marinomonas aquimarina]
MKQITPNFYVAEQLTPSHMTSLAEAGIRHLICNRPDHEGEAQTDSAVLKASAEQQGMTFDFLPTAPGQFDAELVKQFAALMAGREGKTLAFCRTGTRSLSLWTLANPEHKSRDVLLSLAEHAGYNMSDLIDRVAQ